MIKIAEQQLFHELEVEYGFPRATCRSIDENMIQSAILNYAGSEVLMYGTTINKRNKNKQ